MLLCAALLFGVTPLNGFVGLKLPSLSALFSVKANAMDSGTCGDYLMWAWRLPNPPQPAAEQESFIARVLRFVRAIYTYLFNLIFVKII